MNDPLAGWEFAPRVWASQLTFPEAPVWHQEALWVTDVSAGGVHRLPAAGPRRTFLADRKGMGGLVVTRDGDLVASGRDLVTVSDGRVVRERPVGSTGLNDMTASQSGDLFVGVLTFRPALGEPSAPGAVARLSKESDEWWWWSGPHWPNGIAAMGDGDLVMADFATGDLWRCEGVDERAGGARDPVTIARSPTGHADGLALDREGRIWVATGPGGTVECRAPSGELLGVFPVGAAFVSSVCFGGPHWDTLFITAAGHPDLGGVVLAVPAPDPGLPTPSADL